MLSPPFNMVGRVLREIEEDNVAEISFSILVNPTLVCKADKHVSHSAFDSSCRKYADLMLAHPWREESTQPSTRMIEAMISARHSSSLPSATSQATSQALRSMEERHS